MHSQRLIAALAALGLLLTGCTPAPVPPSGDVIDISTVKGMDVDRPSFPEPQVQPDGYVTAPSGAGLTGYLNQTIDWSDCEDLECASIVVPLDYAQPSSQGITLALARRTATKEPKLGTLFVNPGGPGASGKELVGGFNNTGLEQYDILGWDPRGTGESTPVTCFGGPETDALQALDQSPDSDAEMDALIRGTYAFGKSCWERSGTLLEHISTVDTVRDLDLMRHLVGDERLNYLGYSYGTQIGATYAELFPTRTGRLVLDAAVDITDSRDTIQAMGFDLALGNFAGWCASEGCSLGSSKEGVLGEITSLLTRLDAQPLPVGNRQLTQSLAATGIAAYLYGGVPAWKALAQDIASAVAGRGERLLRASDLLNDRGQDGNYGSLFYSFIAISCLDDTDKGVADAEELWTSDQRKAPIYGYQFGPGVGCALWPARSEAPLHLTGKGAAPLVVIGATGDPATPYQQAVTMAKQLASGVLITYEGEGHGTFGGKSPCVDRLVIAYLVKGTVPQDGVRCS